jgi:hypothetical protein
VGAERIHATSHLTLHACHVLRAVCRQRIRRPPLYPPTWADRHPPRARSRIHGSRRHAAKQPMRIRAFDLATPSAVQPRGFNRSHLCGWGTRRLEPSACAHVVGACGRFVRGRAYAQAPSTATRTHTVTCADRKPQRARLVARKAARVGCRIVAGHGGREQTYLNRSRRSTLVTLGPRCAKQHVSALFVLSGQVAAEALPATAVSTPTSSSPSTGITPGAVQPKKATAAA